MIRTTSDVQMSLMKELQDLFQVKSVSKSGDGGVLLSYFGPLDKSSRDSIISLTEKAIVQCGATREELKRVGAVVSECLHNVIVHGWIDSNGETLVYLTLEFTAKGLKIHVGNFVDESMSTRLRVKLEKVNDFDKSELRKKSIELLCENENSQPSLSDSPGLGLIKIGASCEQPLEYDFKPRDQKLNLFTLTATVNN